MYLVYKALDGETVPHILPSRLVPPSKRSLVRGSPNISPGVSPTPIMVSTTVREHVLKNTIQCSCIEFYSKK